MKTIQLNAAKGFIAALIIACFAVNVQAQSKMSAKADTSKMAKKKMKKMAMKKDTMKMKTSKMKMGKMKMKKDSTSKM